jgi:hypothetical protein
MHGEGEMGGRLSSTMHGASIWFLGSLFENRRDVVEAELSLVEYRCLQQSCFDSIYGLIAKYFGFARRNS